MAQRIVYRLEDDLDNTEAAETIVFGLDSVSYEIDLSDENAAKLRDLLAPYVAAGRRVGGKRKVGGRRRAGGNNSATEIRAWATENGYTVSSRGRVPAEIREAYERADRRASEYERRFLALQPKPEPVAKPDIFEKPDEFVRSNIEEVVTPLQQQFSSFIETVSRKDAIREHGQERVTEAFSALDQAAKSGDPQAQAIVQSVKQSMDPYGDIVNWYRGAEASRDPDAFFQRRLEEALKDDKFKGELLTKLQPPSEEQPKSVFNLPPRSIGKLPAARSASDDVGSMNDASLFEHAMR